MKHFLLAAAAAAALAACAGDGELLLQRSGAATPPIAAPEAFVEARASVADTVEADGAASIAVSVIEDGVVVWREVIAPSGGDAATAPTPDTTFALGSMAKSMTATLVMSLVEEGRLDLDAPVSDYLDAPPASPFGYAAPTVRQTLQMAGGYPHGSMIHHDAPAGADDADFARYALQTYPAGAAFEYSNFAFGVLETVIESVAHASYAEVARRQLFAPLGMRSASAGVSGAPGAAPLYDADGDALAPYLFVPIGAAGVSASLADLERYALFHLGRLAAPDVVSADGLAALHESKPAGHEDDIFALGWGSAAFTDGERWLITNGSVSGGTSHMTLLPDRGLAVIVASNATSRNGAIDRLAILIAEAAAPGFAERAGGYIDAYESARSATPAADGPFAGRWCGTARATDGATAALALTIPGDGDATLALRERDATSAGATVYDGVLRAQFQDDAERASLTLLRRGDALAGSAVLTRLSEADRRETPYAAELSACP